MQQSTTSTTKVCTRCGTDVSNQPRSKDSSGRYLCAPCSGQQRKAGPQPAGTIETCANCGVAIGALQQRSIWNGHTVCPGCRATLDAESGQAAPLPPPNVQAAADVTPFQTSAARPNRKVASAWRGLLIGLGAVGLGTFWTMEGLAEKPKTYEFAVGGVILAIAGAAIATCFYRAHGRWREAHDPTAGRRLLAGGYKVGLAFLVLGIVGLGGFLPVAAAGAVGVPEMIYPVVGLMGICAGSVVAYLAATSLSGGQCPRCLRFRATRVLASRLLGVSEWTEGRYEKVSIREGMFQNGRALGNVLLPRSVHVTQAEYENRCACRRCGHEWIARSIRRVVR